VKNMVPSMGELAVSEGVRICRNRVVWVCLLACRLAQLGRPRAAGRAPPSR
jgi:hypothetical protein